MVRLIILVLFVGESALAQVASLKINSDLIVHPNQIASVFALTADKLNKTAQWDWPELRYEQPYKTHWAQVQARGPFQLNVRTENLASQELSFEFYWQNPTVNVGQFSIRDTIVREVDGVQLIINLDGSCTNMNWTAPNGLWKIRGKLQWGIVGHNIQVQWREFEFVSNNSAPKPVTSYGACVGPEAIQNALRENVDAVMNNPVRMRELMQQGILNWMNTSLQKLTAGIMAHRSDTIRPNLDLSWEPQFMITLPGGMIRVPGYLTLKKNGVSAFPGVVDRTLNDADYAGATESGFILPKNSIEHVAAFLHTAGELNRRFRSTEVKGFQDMFKSPVAVGAVWPDLEKFAASTVFFFDLQSDGIPQLSNVRPGTTSVGGLIHDIQAPIVIYDSAPYRGVYYPYVDLRSNVTATSRMSIRNQVFTVEMSPSNMPVTARFRSEFKALRAVNEKIDTARLSKSARDFIYNKPFSVTMPDWHFGTDFKASYGNIKLFKESVIMPVSFVKK